MLGRGLPVLAGWYDVHIYPVYRVKVPGILAPTPEAAAEAAHIGVNLYETGQREGEAEDAEYAEDIHSYLVDSFGQKQGGDRLSEIELNGDGQRPEKPDPILERAKKMASMAPAGWEAYVDALNSSERRELAESLEGLLVWAARAFGYADHRHGGGCNDQGHTDSVKNSNKMAAKVRKAIGFTVAKHDISF
jgi:hypothetical protein